MKVVGIIAEYNPFHKGHELLIRRARENGATHIVVVMSGNYVQRGEPAMFSHSARVRAALGCGADVVLQLPVVYAVSGAQKFARAGVRILDALGCVDELVFGSECGDADVIVSAARAVYSENVQTLIGTEMKKGITFAVARENALRSVNEEYADIIRTPNNILGVEYAAAIDETGSRMKPVTFRREGAGHGESDETDGIASASHIRNLVAQGDEWKNFVPDSAAEIFENEIREQKAIVNYDKFETAVLFKLRTTDAASLGLAPDVSEGIENRIIAASDTSSSLEELYSNAKTKRYTHARIRRIVLCHLLGITANDCEIPAPYIRLLGLNARGAELVKAAKVSAKLPIISKTADISQTDEASKRIFEIECRASDIYSILHRKALPCGAEKDFRVIVTD